MLKQIFNFSCPKNWKQALGFYFFYSILIILIGGIIGISLGLILVIASNIGLTNSEFIDSNLSSIKSYGFSIYDVFYHSICIILAILFLYKKSLKNVLSISLLISVVLLSIYIDALLALIPTAILSTFPNKNLDS